MTLTAKALTAAFLLLVTAQSAIATEVCDAFRSPRLQPQLANCESLVRRKLVPNTGALDYTIKYMIANHRKLEDSRCAVQKLRTEKLHWIGQASDACENCKKSEWVEKGIENNCSFVINDLQTPWNRSKSGPTDQTTGYFVDLCSSGPSNLVKKFAINGAKGGRGDDVPREKLSTAPSNSNTLAGAFLLNGKVTNDFVPGNKAKYESIARNFRKCSSLNPRICDTGVPAIRMVGLNSSNNDTEFDKPFHISKYNRGLGCPGIQFTKDAEPMMQKITARGSSLYMSYGGQKFKQVGKSCYNDTSDGIAKGNPPNGNDQRIPVAAERSVASVNFAEHRSVYEVADAKSKFRKMQIDLKNEDGRFIARTKVLKADGTSATVDLACGALGSNEYYCRRSDNGGGFDIQTAPKPRITVGYFSADDEDAEDLVLQSENNKLLVIEGSKSAVSPNDVF